MNANNLQRFHNYLCAVVKYYQAHKSLKNFSNLAKEFKCKAITRELFFQFELDKATGDPGRELSDNIRRLMADMDMKRRQEQLAAYTSQHGSAVKDETVKESAEVEKSLLDKFEEHLKRLHGFIAHVSNAAYNYEDKEVCPSMNAIDSYLYYDLMSMRTWCDEVEYEAAKSFFADMDVATISSSLLAMGENTMHAFLTYIFGSEDGTQLKFNFDARGDKSESNDAIEEALAEYGVFNDVAFHKLESWKGCGHMCIVYKDAPDVLMIVGEDGVDFYTVEDDIFYSYCGDTIIDPGVSCHFGGWGTRSIMAECIKDIFLCKDEAMRQQAAVPERFKGKLLDDLRHTDDIRAMYKDEYSRKVITCK